MRKEITCFRVISLAVFLTVSLAACGGKEQSTAGAASSELSEHDPVMVGAAVEPSSETMDGREKTETPQYVPGDVILADGSVIKAEELTAVDSSNLPVAVVAELRENGTALGVGVHRSSAPLQWAPDNTAGNAMKFTELVCTQNAFESGNADGGDLQGEVDGSGSWSAVCAMDEQGAADAAKNYPAFHFVNTYAETFGLTGDYASGWYLPSIAELYAVYRNREAINNSLKQICRLDSRAAMDGLGTNWYWSSSQSGSSDDYAWFIHYFNGYGSDCPKSFTNLHVLAVRVF